MATNRYSLIIHLWGINMRASQVFWYLEADEAPTVTEAEHHYSHIDAVYRGNRARLNKMRKEYRKQTDVYKEIEQGDLVTLPNTGPGPGSQTD